MQLAASVSVSGHGSRAVAIDPQDRDDVVADAVDRCRDQRATRRLGGHDPALIRDLVDEIGRRLELRRLAARDRGRQRARPLAGREHERAVGLERGSRGVARRTRDSVAAGGPDT